MTEDENGHLIDDAGALVHDPRCYFCLNQEPANVTVVRVDIPPREEP